MAWRCFLSRQPACLEPLGGSPLPAMARPWRRFCIRQSSDCRENPALYLQHLGDLHGFPGFLVAYLEPELRDRSAGAVNASTHSLIWLLTRPLPRWSIYLAKFVAILPWSLGMNLGGFAFSVCWRPTRPFGFTSLLARCAGWHTGFLLVFHLMSAVFRRAAVLALVYSFFLEWIVGNMPGNMKRMSISFYTRCLMFDAAEPYGLQPDRPSIYFR